MRRTWEKVFLHTIQTIKLIQHTCSIHLPLVRLHLHPSAGAGSRRIPGLPHCQHLRSKTEQRTRCAGLVLFSTPSNPWARRDQPLPSSQTRPPFRKIRTSKTSQDPLQMPREGGKRHPKIRLIGPPRATGLRQPWLRSCCSSTNPGPIRARPPAPDCLPPPSSRTGPIATRGGRKPAGPSRSEPK